MAAGETLISMDVRFNTPPPSNAATFFTRNSRPILRFDPDTDSHAIFPAIMPKSYTGNGVDVILYWMSDQTAGNVMWAASFEACSPSGHDLDNDDFAQEQSQAGTAPSTSGVLTYTTISFADGVQMDSVMAGMPFRLRVTRDADNSADTCTGQAQLLFVEVRERSA